MILQELLADLRSRQVQLTADGDKLRCNAPAGALTPELRAVLSLRKQEILDFLRAAEAVSRQQPGIVPLQGKGSRPPVFAISGHNGNVFMFQTIARELGDDQPFYGLQPPGLDGQGTPLTDIPDFATYFADQIIQVRPAGPYVLLGFCAGGSIAFELAQELTRRGKSVSLLGLIASPYPAAFRSLNFKQKVRHWRDRVMAHASALAGLRSIRAFRDYVMGMRGRLKMQAELNRSAPPPDPTAGWRASVEAATMTGILRYQPAPYAGRAALFLPNRPWLRAGTQPLRWHKVLTSASEYFGSDTVTMDSMLKGTDADLFIAQFRRACSEPQAPSVTETGAHPALSVSATRKA